MHKLARILAAVFTFAMCAALTVEARSITGVSRHFSQGQTLLDVTFEAGEPGDKHALYIAYDTEDKGADISNWAALQRGCVVSADATSATIPVSPLMTGAGYTFCRVFLTTSAAPYDTLIEYLRQTGTQHIDTGIKPNGNSAVAVIDAKLDSNATRQQRFFGVSSDDTTAKFSFDCYINGSGYFASACQNGKGNWKSTEKFTTDRVRISLSAADKHRVAITNVVTGAQIINTKYSTTCSNTSVANLLIFAQNQVVSSSATPKNYARGANLYSFKMTQGGSCVCDYKPCKLGNRAGVYDAVAGNIRYSASGTDFDAANSGSPIACSLLAGETQIAAAPAATGLFSDYTWRGAAANWGDANAWTKDGASATWANGNNAIFATANATATLAADVTANGIAFNADATIATNGTDAATLAVKSVSVDSGVTATISAPTTGALEKTGAGTLTLAANRAAATTVTEGTLKMDGATVAGLTLGTDGGAPVTFDYGGQELVKNAHGLDYLVTGSTVMLTNGIFSTASGYDLNIRDDTFTMPSVLTIAKDAVVRQGDSDNGVYLNNADGTATINIVGGTLGKASGSKASYIQHKSVSGRLNINVTEGGLLSFPATVQALTGGVAGPSPSLYMMFADSTFNVGGPFNFGSNQSNADFIPETITGVFSATNSVISIGTGFTIGRNTRDAKSDGALTADFEGCTVTATTFAVYYDRPLNNARFNDTRFVFNAASGFITANDGESNWITVGDDGLTIDTQTYAASLNANLGGSGAVTKTGTGTLTVSRGQTTTGGFNVSEGTLALNAGLIFNRPIAVASGATLSVNAANTASVSNLTLAAGSTLNIASYTLGVTPLAVATSATLPESGTVNLTIDGGAFGEGVYTIYSAPGVTAADGDKFSPGLAIVDLIPSWSVEDGALVLTLRATAQTWNGAAGESVSWADGWTGGAWVETHDAIFNTAGAIASVDADVSANAVKFNESATVNGSATLTPHVVFVAEGKEATISAPTAGALEKTGLGALTLTEDRADATTVTEGTLKMDGATVAGLTLGTDGGAPVTFDYGGQELVTNNVHGLNYLVTGSTVMLTNGIFSTASGYDLNIRDDTFTMPSVLTIAKDAVVRQGAPGKSIYINNVSVEARTINVVGGTLGNTEGCNEAYLQHKSSAGDLNINVTEGGLVCLPCTVYALCGNNTVRTTPSLYMTFDNSAFIAGTFNFGNIYKSHDYAPTSPTAVFAATNSVVSVANDFIVGRDKQDSKTDGSYRVDFEGSIVTAKTFTVYYDRPLNNARFNNTRFVFNAESGSIAANDSAANWFTVGAGGLTLDTQEYSATLNANLGGSGAVTKVGAGTLTLARDQTSTAAFNVGEGTLALNAGLTVNRPIAVASGATLSVNAADTASLSNLTLAAGSSLNIASYTFGVTPLAVATSATLPESGTVNLTIDGGAFGEGVYAIYSAPGMTTAVGDKFAPSTGELDFSWSVSGDKLVLTVGELPGNYWTGLGGDGRMSTAANWAGNAVPAAGSDIDLSAISSATTIIADTGRAFGTVTMGNAIVTFASNLTVTAFSNMLKLAVAADSTVTIDNDITLGTGGQVLCKTIAAGGTLHITGSVEVSHSSGEVKAADIATAEAGAPGAIVVEGGIAIKTDQAVIWNAKTLALGASGISFTRDAPFYFTVKGAEVYSLGATTVLGTGGIGKFRSRHDDVSLCTTQYGSDQPVVITFDGNFNGASSGSNSYWGHWRATGGGRVVCTAASSGNRGLRVYAGATFALTPSSKTLGQSDQHFDVHANATLEVAASGTRTITGDLNLDSGAVLGFNFTDRTSAPVLALSSGKSVVFTEGESTNITVKVSGTVRPKGGEHQLTTCGGFGAEGVSVSLAAGTPKWVKGVSVNGDGNIVITVNQKGLMIIFK